MIFSRAIPDPCQLLRTTNPYFLVVPRRFLRKLAPGFRFGCNRGLGTRSTVRIPCVVRRYVRNPSSCVTRMPVHSPFGCGSNRHSPFGCGPDRLCARLGTDCSVRCHKPKTIKNSGPRYAIFRGCSMWAQGAGSSLQGEIHYLHR